MIIRPAPGLDDARRRQVADQQQAGGLQRRVARRLVAGQLPGRDAGQRIEEAQIVVVDMDSPLDPVPEASDLVLGGLAVAGLAGDLIGKPQHPGPEAVGPFDVVDRRIDAVDAGGRGEGVGKDFQIAVDADQHRRQDRVQLVASGRGAGQ
jgi:hypothetical protein